MLYSPFSDGNEECYEPKIYPLQNKCKYFSGKAEVFISSPQTNFKKMLEGIQENDK